MIDQLTIEKIRDAARIEEVVGDFVTLKRAGVNLKGLCPFHDDRTPSFVVSPAKNYCKCFACGEGGNPVTFIMKHEKVSYADALRYLAKKYNIEIEERELTPEESQRNDDRESMFILNEWANKWFQNQLRNTPDGQTIGLSYFRGRGFRDDILEKFQVGYCPNSRTNPMTTDALAAGYQERFLTNTPDEQDTRQSVGTGLSFKNAKGELRDRFFGRVIWPIFTLSGRVAGFGGRVLDAATKGVNIKYQNSPESIVYSKRHELYGLYQARQAISKQDSCYLVEGYTDVMAMHQAGVENVVASSGTALTEEQIRLIHRLTSNIVVIYDGDAAGIKASQRGIDMLLRQGMNVRLLLLPDGDDPDSFSRKHSAEEFQNYLKENQVDFIKFKTNLLMEEAKNDPVALSKLVGNIVQSIAEIPDEITRSLYIRESATMMNLQEILIGNAVNKQRNALNEEWRRQREREQRCEERAGQAGNNEGLTDSSPFKGNKRGSDGSDKSDTSDASDGFERAERSSESLSVEAATLEEIANMQSPVTAPFTAIEPKQRMQEQRFYREELELMRVLMRMGEQDVEVTAEDGSAIFIKVAEVIDDILAGENIRLRNPLFQKILNEAVAHCHDEGFVAETYFLNYPDDQISSLAFDLVTDREQLSKMHERGKSKYVVEEPPSPYDMVLHLLMDYKLELIKEQVLALMKQLTNPEIVADESKYQSLAAQLMELKAQEKELSKLRGDRVIV